MSLIAYEPSPREERQKEKSKGGNGAPDKVVAGHEFLAVVRGFDPEAAEDPMTCSPLYEAWQTGKELELDTAKWPTLLALPLLLLASVMIAVVVWPYELMLKFRLKAMTKKTTGNVSKHQRQRVREMRERALLGPKWMSVLLGRITHPRLQMLREGVTTSAALRSLHGAHIFFRDEIPRLKWYRRPGAYVARFIMDSIGPRAVNNRHKLVYTAMYQELRYQHGERVRYSPKGAYRDTPVIEVLSLACGSAESILFAIARFTSDYPGADVRLTLVDLNQESLDQARRLADRLGIGQLVETKMAKLQDFLKAAGPEAADIIEMVGFLDYRNEKSLLQLCSAIWPAVRPGGLFLTAHIGPSIVDFVVRWLINWPELIHRTSSEFCRLLEKAGWTTKGAVESEPQDIHHVARLRRLDS